MDKILILEDNVKLLRSILLNFYYYNSSSIEYLFNKINISIESILEWFRKIFSDISYEILVYKIFFFNFFCKKILECEKYFLDLIKINLNFIRFIPSELMNKKIIKFVVYSKNIEFLHYIPKDKINCDFIHCSRNKIIFFKENKQIEYFYTKDNIEIYYSEILIYNFLYKIDKIELLNKPNIDSFVYKKIKELKFMFKKNCGFNTNYTNYYKFVSDKFLFEKKEINTIITMFKPFSFSYLKKIERNNELLINELSNYNYDFHNNIYKKVYNEKIVKSQSFFIFLILLKILEMLLFI